MELLAFAAQDGGRLVGHAHDVGRLDEQDAVVARARAPPAHRPAALVSWASMTAVGPTSCSSRGAGSSASASSAPATGAWGAKSPPMASTQMRAKLTLPARPLAAHRRSTRTRGTRGADASSCRTAGTSGSRSPARFLCVLRARFLRLDVRRFGTAMEIPWKKDRRTADQDDESRMARSTSHRASVPSLRQSHEITLRSAPQIGHNP